MSTGSSSERPPTGRQSPCLLVVIVTTDDGHWLRPCLKALERSLLRPTRVVVVDNCCSDASKAIAEAADLPMQVLATPQRLGFASCNNLALRIAMEAGFDYVYMLNPDTVVHEAALGTLVSFLDDNGSYRVVGSLQFDYDRPGWETLNDWSRLTLQEAASLGNLPREVGGVQVVDHHYVQGAAMMLRVELLPELGMLDPVYRTFYEETDFCRRCLLQGGAVGLVFGSRVKHVGGANWRSTRQRHLQRDRLYLRNQFIFFLSLPQSRSAALLATCRLIYRQICIVVRGRDDVILNPLQYSLVLLSVLRARHAIRRLCDRNERILARQGCLPADLISIILD